MRLQALKSRLCKLTVACRGVAEPLAFHQKTRLNPSPFLERDVHAALQTALKDRPEVAQALLSECLALVLDSLAAMHCLLAVLPVLGTELRISFCRRVVALVAEQGPGHPSVWELAPHAFAAIAAHPSAEQQDGSLTDRVKWAMALIEVLVNHFTLHPMAAAQLVGSSAAAAKQPGGVAMPVLAELLALHAEVAALLPPKEQRSPHKIKDKGKPAESAADSQRAAVAGVIAKEALQLYLLSEDQAPDQALPAASVRFASVDSLRKALQPPGSEPAAAAAGGLALALTDAPLPPQPAAQEEAAPPEEALLPRKRQKLSHNATQRAMPAAQPSKPSTPSAPASKGKAAKSKRTPAQLAILEAAFPYHASGRLNETERTKLALATGLRKKQVITWFSDKKAKIAKASAPAKSSGPIFVRGGLAKLATPPRIESLTNLAQAALPPPASSAPSAQQHPPALPTGPQPAHPLAQQQLVDTPEPISLDVPMSDAVSPKWEPGVGFPEVPASDADPRNEAPLDQSPDVPTAGADAPMDGAESEEDAESGEEVGTDEEAESGEEAESDEDEESEPPTPARKAFGETDEQEWDAYIADKEDLVQNVLQDNLDICGLGTQNAAKKGAAVPTLDGMFLPFALSMWRCLTTPGRKGQAGVGAYLQLLDLLSDVATADGAWHTHITEGAQITPPTELLSDLLRVLLADGFLALRELMPDSLRHLLRIVLRPLEDADAVLLASGTLWALVQDPRQADDSEGPAWMAVLEEDWFQAWRGALKLAQRRAASLELLIQLAGRFAAALPLVHSVNPKDVVKTEDGTQSAAQWPTPPLPEGQAGQMGGQPAQQAQHEQQGEVADAVLLAAQEAGRESDLVLSLADAVGAVCAAVLRSSNLPQDRVLFSGELIARVLPIATQLQRACTAAVAGLVQLLSMDVPTQWENDVLEGCCLLCAVGMDIVAMLMRFLQWQATERPSHWGSRVKALASQVAVFQSSNRAFLKLLSGPPRSSKQEQLQVHLQDLLGQAMQHSSNALSVPPSLTRLEGDSEDEESGGLDAPKKRKAGKRRAVHNPYIKAAMAEETAQGAPGSDEDSDYSDLDDFIVCKPGRDYSTLLSERFQYSARE
ncbi:hypothetical protein WJX72_009947 [[Myrmecia] bisecta]|uniref:Homeobox domain-containing protein n=1 Tax=[Myrmecia] bisecta TaxID=41462 RepID=A0AAW1R9N3_9CHLO